MLLDTIFLRDNHVILRDVDGSEVSLTAEDAILFLMWIRIHGKEVTAYIYTPDKEEARADGQT